MRASAFAHTSTSRTSGVASCGLHSRNLRSASQPPGPAPSSCTSAPSSSHRPPPSPPFFPFFSPLANPPGAAAGPPSSISSTTHTAASRRKVFLFATEKREVAMTAAEGAVRTRPARTMAPSPNTRPKSASRTSCPAGGAEVKVSSGA
eukprot:308811-Pelagomonas_calceolata.AAC.1